MKLRRALALLAPLLNITGVLLLFLSLQSTSTIFRFVSVADYNMSSGEFAKGQTTYALCVNDNVLTETDSFGDLTLNMRSCPKAEQAQSAAVVTARYPILQSVGLILSVIGFGIQFILACFAPSERATRRDPVQA